MLYNKRTVLWTGEEKIPAKKEFSLPFNSNALSLCEGLAPTDYRYKLRIRGDADVQQNWMWEGGYPLLYRDIDDSLCTEVTSKCQYSLKFNLKEHQGRNYPRRAYCKLACPPELSPQFPVPNGGLGLWQFSISAKADKLTLSENGRIGVSFDIWEQQDGILSKDINRAPERSFSLPFDNGSYDWQKYSMPIEITENMVMILVTIYAEDALGTLWLEEPLLTNGDNQQLLPQFTVASAHHEYMNWLGENLSHKDWTDLQPVVNGQQLPMQELFQRCHRGCEHEIPLPNGLILQGENIVTLQNVNDYFSPIPFKLMQIELLYEQDEPFQIVAFPQTAVAGKNLAILIETAKPNLTLSVACDNSAIAFPQNLYCEKAGLQVLKGHTGDNGADISVTISVEGIEKTYVVERIVERQEDNVLTGTSDSIYIPQDDFTLMQEFLVWYFHNQIGNFITFRPVYRWTGARELAPETWEEIRRICTELEIPFCHIIDGRELPGMNANPSKKMLESPYFVGNQGHERDGALYYWRQRRSVGSDLLFHEITHKNHRHPDYDYSSPICYEEHGNYLYFDPITPKNMMECAEQYVEKSRVSLAGIKRHTGPSVLFRYFFEAGLEVGGAELMYGPQEIILAALRGASRAYSRKEFAAHLAVQWSSTPHDTPERFLRYQLSLFVSYLQGVHHINTEEGLYRMEEMFTTFDRFSECCIGHLKVQQDFAKFVATHSRMGTMVNPIAVLHGQYDGWVCFGRSNAWGHYGDEWKFNLPEESWDLLRLFYPDNKLQALYVHPCPNEPQGFFSRTPYGNVDIVPIEASDEILSDYPFISFLGYNATVSTHIEKLTSYVKQGGTLLLSWAHLNTALDRSEVINDVPTLLDCTLLTGCMPTGFTKMQDGYRTGLIDQVGDNEVLERDAQGLPLVLRHKLGNGAVYLFNTAEFPANSSIRPLYEKYLKMLSEQTISAQYQKGWATGTDTVETAAYDRPDASRMIYAINTNWWDSGHLTAESILHIGERKFALPIPRGVISTILLADDAAILASDNETELLELRATIDTLTLALQGKGISILHIIPPIGFILQNCNSENGVFSVQVDLNGKSIITLGLEKE